MASFASALQFLTDLHIYDAVVPFILVYAIVLGLLKSDIFKTGKTISEGLQSIIAFAIALSVAATPGARNIIINTLPQLSVFAVLLFMILFLLLMTGIPKDHIIKYIMGPEPLKEGQPAGIVWIVIILVAIIIIMSGLTSALPDLNAGDLQAQALAQNTTVLQIVDTLSPLERIVYYTSLPQVAGFMVLLFLFGAAAFFISNER